MAPGPGSFWDALRDWADSAGLLLPDESGPGPRRRPTVPRAVCDNCPICQAAATLDEVNPEVFEELVDMARNVLAGLGSALASAEQQRGPVVPGEPVADPRREGAASPGTPGGAPDDLADPPGPQQAPDGPDQG